MRLIRTACAALLFCFALAGVTPCAGVCRAAQNALPAPEASAAKIGSTTGSACEEYALQYYPNARYFGYENPIDALTALSVGSIDYVVTTEVDANNYNRKHGGIRIAENDLLPSESNIAVPKGHTALLAQIDEVLTRFLEDGTIARMEENWIRLDGTPYVEDAVPELADAPLLRVAICAGFEPMAFLKDDALTGFDVELIKRVAYALGYRAALMETEFSAVLLDLESGRADVAISGLYANEQRRKIADFSKIYYYDTIVLVCRDAEAAPTQAFTKPADSFRTYFLAEEHWKMLARGGGVTLMISICSGLLGVLLGILLCALRFRRPAPVSATVAGFIRVIQGTPLVLILMLLYYVVFPRHSLNGLLTAILAFGLSAGVDVAEILRNGVEAVDPAQWEAGAALGLSKGKTFRAVILPQAAKHFMPLMIDEYATLIKSTSIVGYVAVQDLTKVSDMIRSRSYEAFFPIVFSAAIYFLLSFALTMPLRRLAGRINPEPRPRTLKGVKRL